MPHDAPRAATHNIYPTLYYKPTHKLPHRVSRAKPDHTVIWFIDAFVSTANRMFQVRVSLTKLDTPDEKAAATARACPPVRPGPQQGEKVPTNYFAEHEK